MRILKSGAFFDQDRKELEPLGQEILPVEPPASQPAPSPENVRFSAQEPEWQCQTAESTGDRSFFKKPIHCQKALLTANTAGFDDLHPYKEETIVTIELNPNLPARGLWTSESDRTMSYSLRSTAKKTDDDGDGSEPCKFDDGRPECVVQSERSDYNPIAFNDAENSGDGIGQVIKLPTHQELADGLASARKRNEGKCGEFLDKLRNQLGIKKTFEQLFSDLVKEYDNSKGKSGGVAYVRELTTPGFTTSGEGSKATVDDGKYPYNVKNGPKNALALKIKPEHNNNFQLDAYVDTLIHELIHYAGIEDHNVFATKGFESLDASGRKSYPLNNGRTDSQYFTDLLRDYCKR